jgi:hypothetical protein
MTELTYKKEILLQDERNRNMAAVIRYGPHLFLSSSDGHRDIETEQVVPELDAQAMAVLNQQLLPQLEIARGMLVRVERPSTAT